MELRKEQREAESLHQEEGFSSEEIAQSAHAALALSRVRSGDRLDTTEDSVPADIDAEGTTKEEGSQASSKPKIENLRQEEGKEGLTEKLERAEQEIDILWNLLANVLERLEELKIGQSLNKEIPRGQQGVNTLNNREGETNTTSITGEDNRAGETGKGATDTLDAGTIAYHQLDAKGRNRRNNLIILGHREINRDREPSGTNRGEARQYSLELINKLLGKDCSKEVGFEAHRIGALKEGRPRPICMSFQRAEIVDQLLKKGYKMRELQKEEKVSLRRDLSSNERKELKAQLEEVRQLNDHRDENDKQNFFFKVIEGKIVKRVIHKKKRIKLKTAVEGTNY